MANPTGCYIELYNASATRKTTIEEFIENSILTFYYSGSIII
jgi:hypothetical protein